MGGFGSGSQGRRAIAENLPGLDVREVQKRGLLMPGTAFRWFWKTRVERIASIDLVVRSREEVTLGYTWRDRKREKGETINERVDLDWTPCHYGGERVWFKCPRCGKRVAILWGRRRFLCRGCNEVAYATENMTKLDRLITKWIAMGEKLGFAPDDFGPMIKPKRMHATTFERLRREYRKLDEQLDLAMHERYGKKFSHLFPQG